MEAGEGTVDPDEIGRFAEQADAWWNPHGSFFALHKLNPVRLGFIRSRLAGHFRRDPGSLRPFTGLSLLDIGCGGGLVTEPMTRLGFSVTGIDPSPEAIARCTRARADQLILISTIVLAPSKKLRDGPKQFDVVLALEVIEHVTDRDAFLHCLGSLVAPGGAAIVATLNRTARSFALAIVGAEYVLGWIPRGTHDWRKFVRPSELILGLGRNRLRAIEITGFVYSPGDAQWRLSRRYRGQLSRLGRKNLMVPILPVRWRDPRNLTKLYSFISQFAGFRFGRLTIDPMRIRLAVMDAACFLRKSRADIVTMRLDLAAHLDQGLPHFSDSTRVKASRPGTGQGVAP